MWWLHHFYLYYIIIISLKSLIGYSKCLHFNISLFDWLFIKIITSLLYLKGFRDPVILLATLRCNY